MQRKSKEKKLTVGEQYASVAFKEPESRDPIELQREMQKDYLDNLVATVEEFRKEYPQDFYAVQLTKREKLLPNVLRNYFFCRLSCPTPEYDQSVYRYLHKEERIEYLWTVPDRVTCLTMRENAAHIPPEEKQLLDCVLSFLNGDLLMYAKRLNGEQKYSPFIQ